MSTVLHRREINIAITAEDSAIEFANAAADVQSVFLLQMVRMVDQYSWAIQCRFIADEMDDGQRQSVANMLETLVEHLREVRDVEG